MSSTAGRFAHDIFISYCHADNQRRWVSSFHHHLRLCLEERLGRPVNIWRDERSLPEAGQFNSEIFRHVENSAVFVPVISPSYSNSDWCRRELDCFLQRLPAGDPPRILKIVRLPLPHQRHRNYLPAQIEHLGIEFFTTPAVEGRHQHEFEPDDPRFLARTKDAASELARLLAALGPLRPAPAPGARAAVYLAPAAPPLQQVRLLLQAELEARNFPVLDGNASPLPPDPSALRLAVHLVGDGEFPDAWACYDAVREAGLRQFVWIAPPGPDAPPSGPPRLQALRLQPPEFLFEGTAPVSLRQELLEALNSHPAPPPQPPVVDGRAVSIYLDYPPEDDPYTGAASDHVRALLRHLKSSERLAVRIPPDDGRTHQHTRDVLKEVDGVLLFWDNGSFGWFQAEMVRLTKAYSWRKSRGFTSKAYYVAGVPTPHKLDPPTECEAVRIEGFEGFDPALLESFLLPLRRLRRSGASSHGA